MKVNKNLIAIGTGVIILGIIIYYYIQKEKLEDDNKQLKEENDSLKNYIDNLHSEVNEIINEQPDLDETVKSELKKLIDNYQHLDEDIRNELISAKALMDVNQNSKATLVLVKIIENLLKRTFQNDENFKSKYNKKPVLDNYIEFANETKLLSKDEYHFMKGIKELRNKEAHEVGLQLPKLLGASSVLLGLQLIFKLARI